MYTMRDFVTLWFYFLAFFKPIGDSLNTRYNGLKQYLHRICDITRIIHELGETIITEPNNKVQKYEKKEKTFISK